jgi:hypothetical protein
MYFSYAIFLIDYKKILKIAGGKKLGHNIVLKEIQRTAQRTEWSLVHLTGMMHCASFSGMEQFGSRSRGTVSPAPQDNSFDNSLNRHEITV